MCNILKITLLIILLTALPNQVIADPAVNFLLLLSSSDELKNSIPEAFIDSVDIKDESITLHGHFKDDDNDPFVNASWELQDLKGSTLYDFSGLDVINAEITYKGELIIVLRVTTGTGSRQKTSLPVGRVITI